MPKINKWLGATRSRSLHVRLPFAVQLHLDVAEKHFKIKSIQHRGKLFTIGFNLEINLV